MAFLAANPINNVACAFYLLILFDVVLPICVILVYSGKQTGAHVDF